MVRQVAKFLRSRYVPPPPISSKAVQPYGQRDKHYLNPAAVTENNHGHAAPCAHKQNSYSIEYNNTAPKLARRRCPRQLLAARPNAIHIHRPGPDPVRKSARCSDHNLVASFKQPGSSPCAGWRRRVERDDELRRPLFVGVDRHHVGAGGGGVGRRRRPPACPDLWNQRDEAALSNLPTCHLFGCKCHQEGVPGPVAPRPHRT